MTINAQTGISDVQLGDGVNLVFPFDFKIATADEISVYVDGVLVVATDYTVAVAEDWSGDVTFDVAPADNAEVVLVSNPLFVQSSVHQRQGPFFADVVEDDLDKATLRDIHLRRQFGRALSVGPLDTAPPVDASTLTEGRVLAVVGDEIVGLDTDLSSAAGYAAAAQAAATIAIAQADRAEGEADDAEIAADLAQTAKALAEQVSGATYVKATWAELFAETGTAGQIGVSYEATGTHTDPVVGGTVANGGLFVWTLLPTPGWKFASLLESAQAYTHRVAAEAAADSILGFPADFPISKLAHAWDFTRGSDNIVPDLIGSLDIDLDAAPSGNYRRIAQGVRTRNAAIETEILTDIRDLTLVYRPGADPQTTTAFLLSFNDASIYDGVLYHRATPASSVLDTANSYYYMGAGGDVAPLLIGADGSMATAIRGEGWNFLHTAFPANITNRVGIGGVSTVAAFRMLQLDTAWLFAWHTPLNDAERQIVGRFCRKDMAEVGAFLHPDDCLRRGKLTVIVGTSNSAGRALISDAADLSVGDRNRVVRQIMVSASYPLYTSPFKKFDTFEMGFNQHPAGDAATEFGPAYGVALAARDNADEDGVDNYLVVCGFGGSYTAAVGDIPAVVYDNTWHAGSAKKTGNLYNAIRIVQHAAQQMLSRGIGFDGFTIGAVDNENDMTDVDLAPDSATVAARSQARYDAWQTYFAGTPIRYRQVIPHDLDPRFDATAAAATRAGLALAFDGNPANPLAEIINIDDLVDDTGVGFITEEKPGTGTGNLLHYDGATAIAIGGYIANGRP